MGNSAINNNFTQYPDTLVNNFSWIGEAISGFAGELLSFGDFVRYNLTTGRWYKAQADTYSNARCDGVWVDTTTAIGDYGTALVKGTVRNDTWNWSDPAIWLSSTTAGTGSSVQPSAIGEQIQYLGLALSSNTMFFNPSNDIATL